VIVAAPPGADAAIARFVPRWDARTRQSLVVRADPATTYAAIRAANLAAAWPARLLTAAAMVPERIGAWVRGQAPPARTGRTSRLGTVLAADGPWTLLAETDRELVLGLLWSPPAGGDKRPASEWAAFAEPGYAKVAWSLSVSAQDAGRTLLSTETRTIATDERTRRRFWLIWAVIAPFAALLRRLVLRAIRDEAERPGRLSTP